MKKHFAYFLLFLLFTSSSCTPKHKYGNPVVSPDTILKNMMAFLNYRERNVMLSEDFAALNTASKIISKETFLQLLSSGEYLPLRLESKDSSICYQLYKLSTSDNAGIRMTLNCFSISPQGTRNKTWEIPRLLSGLVWPDNFSSLSFLNL